MAFFWVVVIRGGRKPFVVLSACKIALAFKAAPTDNPAPKVSSAFLISILFDTLFNAGKDDVKPPNFNKPKPLSLLFVSVISPSVP